MSEKDFIYRRGVKIFEEADKKEFSITSICEKYHVSRKWFYKWKKRNIIVGHTGIYNVLRRRGLSTLF